MSTKLADAPGVSFPPDRPKSTPPANPKGTGGVGGPTARPYYQRSGIVLHLGDCREILPSLAPDSVDFLCTDPPYDAQTHARARSVTVIGGVFKGGRQHVTFASATAAEIAETYAMAAHACKRWLVATMELRHAVDIERSEIAGWKFIRHGCWVKDRYAPQISGDRPAQGWEAIVIMHRDVPGRMRWTGGGHCAVYNCSTVVRNRYPAEKPVELLRQFFVHYADAGGLVLDPYCGSGTTLAVAAERGQPAIGCDINEAALEIAAKRLDGILSQGLLDFGGNHHAT